MLELILSLSLNGATMISNQRMRLMDWCYLLLYMIPTLTGLSKLDIKIGFKIPPTAYASTTTYITVKQEDPRANKLQNFLQSKNSPLAPYAELIISESDRYAVDWTKIVAISRMESDYGNRIPKNSFNAWGLGGHNLMHFENWEEAIRYEAKLLGESYKQAENNGVKVKYCPSSDGCNQQWSFIVTNASKEILGTK